MILPIIFIHFSLFIVAHSNPEENVEKFNDFIKIHFGIKPSSPSTSHAHVQHLGTDELSGPLIQVAQLHDQNLSYEELSKFLFQVEEKVANGVLQEGPPRIDGIYEDFHNTLTTKESSLLGNLGNLLPHRHNKDNHKHEQLKSHLATFNKDEQGKVQFIMLLLSFATRVAFTMGSEALKKQKLTHKIQMNSFLQAYEKMEKAIRVANYGNNPKYRYYQGANLYPNDKDNNMRFELVTNENHSVSPHMRKDNHEKLSLFSHQKKRISRIIKVLEQIDQYSPVHENLFDEESFVTDLMVWNQHDYPDPEYTKVKMFALKRFGMNLASHILRQEIEWDNSDARAYFRLHGPARDKLKSLFEKLKKAVEELGPFDINNEAEVKFMNEQEMFLHYEDALELNWKPETKIYLKIVELFFKWTTTMTICNSKTAKILEENKAKLEEMTKENTAKIEEIKKENEAKLEELTKENKPKIEEIKKEFDEKKAFFESFMPDFDIASLEHDFEEVLESMAPLKMLALSFKLQHLSMQLQIAIHEEFKGLA